MVAVLAYLGKIDTQTLTDTLLKLAAIYTGSIGVEDATEKVSI